MVAASCGSDIFHIIAASPHSSSWASDMSTSCSAESSLEHDPQYADTYGLGAANPADCIKSDLESTWVVSPSSGGSPSSQYDSFEVSPPFSCDSVSSWMPQYAYSKIYPNSYTFSDVSTQHSRSSSSSGSSLSAPAINSPCLQSITTHLPQTVLRAFPERDVSPVGMQQIPHHQYQQYTHQHQYPRADNTLVPPQVDISFNPQAHGGQPQPQIPYPLCVTPSDLFPSESSSLDYSAFVSKADLEQTTEKKRKRSLDSEGRSDSEAVFTRCSPRHHKALLREYIHPEILADDYQEQPSSGVSGYFGWSESDSSYPSEEEEDDEWTPGFRSRSKKYSMSQNMQPFIHNTKAPHRSDSGLIANEEKLYTKAGSERKNKPIPVPVPVPNLIKKSRGRKVPVVDTSISATPETSPSPISPDGGSSVFKTSKGSGRAFTCTIPGCGKRFVRGEHLKRHVRSIHTHEKPHVCPHKGCNKGFSRRDNLAQHFRLHT